MKIASIDIIELPAIDGMRIVVCRIDSDTGLHGLGEIGVAIGVGATAAREVIRDVAPMFLGCDPLETSVLWEKFYRRTFWGVSGGPILMSALSAIDTALWDLKARAFGVPLCVLLGGAHRRKLRCYASQLQMGWGVERFTHISDPADYREMTRRALGEGFTAIKANVLWTNENCRMREPGEMQGHLSRELLELSESRLAAMREAAGDKVDIILENHCATDANTAIEFAKMAEKYDIMFLEEPATPLNPELFAKIADATRIPLATGERTYLAQGFLPLITKGRISVAQPDIGNCGGVTEFMRIAALCSLWDVGIQAHVCSGPISVAAALQCEAAIPNFVIHEHHVMNTTPHNTAYGLYNYQPAGGYFDVPELPGIGQELSDYAMSAATVTHIA